MLARGRSALSLSTSKEVISDVMSLVMYDSIDPTQMSGLAMDAAAGYIDGKWQTFPRLGQFTPNGTYLMSITVFGNEAEAADIENGDLTTVQGAQWAKAMLALGHWRPVVYTQANNIDNLVTELAAVGVTRNQVRLWSAHYNFVPHICAPTACGFSSADGTQWTNSASGRNLDQSQLPSGFFTRPTPSPGNPPVPQEDEEMLITFGNDSPPRAGIPVPANVDHIRLTCWQGATITVSFPGVAGNTQVSLDGSANGRVDVAIPAGQTGQCVLTQNSASGPVYAVFFKSV